MSKLLQDSKSALLDQAVINKTVANKLGSVGDTLKDIGSQESQIGQSLLDFVKSQTENTDKTLSFWDSKLDSLFDDFKGVKDGKGDPLKYGDVELPSYLEPIRPIIELAYFLQYLSVEISNSVDELSKDIDGLGEGDYDTLEQFLHDIYGGNITKEIIQFISLLLGFVPFVKNIVQTRYAKAYTELQFLVNKETSPQRS